MSYRQAEELGYVPETDGGAVWRDWYDEILSGDTSKDRSRGGAGDTGINPTTDLPWDVYPDATSPTGYTYTPTGAPVYKDGSSWNGDTSNRVGGGNTYNYNTTAANDLGAGRYKFVTSDGSDGLPAGTTYQLDQLDGSMSSIKYPSGGNSKESYPGSGVTNEGISIYAISSSKSPTGYMLADGTIVLANGADAGMGKVQEQGGSSKQTWTGYGPKGQGTYYLDGPGGTPGTFIGATTAAGAGLSSSSGGGGLSGGGGGSTSTSSREGGFNNTTTERREGGFTNNTTSFNTSDIGPNTVASQQAARAQDQAQFDLQFAYKQQQDALNRGDTLAARAEQQKIDNAKLKLEQIAAFRSAVTDTDPLAQQAWIYGGLGNPANAASGGNFMNAIKQGGDALSENVLSGAAAILGEMRGNPSGGLSGGQIADSGGGALDGAAGGVGVSALTPASVTGGVAAGASSAPMASAPPPIGRDPNAGEKQSAALPHATIMVGANERSPGQPVEVLAGADGQPLLDANGNMALYDPNEVTGSGIRYSRPPMYDNKTGQHYYTPDMEQILINASGQRVDRSGVVQQSEAEQAGINAYAKTLARAGRNTYGGWNFSGLGGQSIDPSKSDYLTPEQQAANATPGEAGYKTLPAAGGLSGGAIQPEPTARPQYPGDLGVVDNRPGTTAVGIDPDLPYKTVIPMLATGGTVQGPYIAGEEGPELATPVAPGVTAVQPLAAPALAPAMTTAAPTYTAPISVGGTVTGVDSGGGSPGALGGGIAPELSPDTPDSPVVRPVPTAPSTLPGSGGLSGGAPAAPAQPVAPVAGIPGSGPTAPPPGTVPGPSIATANTGEGPYAPGSVRPVGTSGDGGGGGGLSGGSLIDEIGAMRRGAQGPQANYMDVAFEKIPYTVRKAYFEWLRDRYGISIENSMEEAQRYRIGGLSRGQLVGSQGR